MGESSRAASILVLAQIVVTMLAIGGGVWGAATWTAAQENKLGRVEWRIEQLERGAVVSAPQENRIGKIEYRIEQNERAIQDDRANRRAFEQEIKGTLNGINTTLTNMQILWARRVGSR